MAPPHNIAQDLVNKVMLMTERSWKRLRQLVSCFIFAVLLHVSSVFFLRLWFVSEHLNARYRGLSLYLDATSFSGSSPPRGCLDATSVVAKLLKTSLSLAEPLTASRHISSSLSACLHSSHASILFIGQWLITAHRFSPDFPAPEVENTTV